jgi:hypothetical protein
MDQLTNGLLDLLMALALYAIREAVVFIKAKKVATEAKMGADKYILMYTVAKSIFNIAEEEFKNVSQAGDQKRRLFDERLLQMFPTLTQEELDHFRQAVVGEFNNGMAGALTPEY